MKSKLWRLLLSLCFALFIWIYVVTVVSPESQITVQAIPIVLNGESILADRDLIIVSDKNFTVDLKLLGNRVDLNKLSSSNITVTADLSQISEPGEHHIRYSVTYPSFVTPGSIEVLEQDPQYITFQVVERGWKKIPVEIHYVGSQPESYVTDKQNAQLDYTTVEVSGPVSMLENVHHARITVDLAGKTSTISENCRPVLCDANNNVLTDTAKLTMNVTEIKVTVKINKIKELPVVVEVVEGGGLYLSNVSLTQSLTSIVVSGSHAALENLDRIVVGTIRLAEVMESTTLKFEITMPFGINNMTGVSEVTVEVEILQQLETKTFTVTRFKLINAPANYKVEMETQKTEVTIRGTAEDLAALKAEDIVVVVDCSDVSGNNKSETRDYTIQLPEGNEAGMISEGQVLVKVTETGTGG